MRSTKSYGVVSCWQEHKMLVKAEHTFERNQKKKVNLQRMSLLELTNGGVVK